MLTVAEVAARLKCSAALVYALCADGKLPHFRLGLGRGAIRVSEEQLRLFLDEVRVQGRAAAPVELKHLRLPPSRRPGRAGAAAANARGVR